MSPEITVLTEHVGGLPYRVYWNFDSANAHTGWQCIEEIMNFLKSHDIEFNVSQFDSTQMAMTVRCAEARTMIRLAVPMFTKDNTDDAFLHIL